MSDTSTSSDDLEIGSSNLSSDSQGGMGGNRYLIRGLPRNFSETFRPLDLFDSLFSKFNPHLSATLEHNWECNVQVDGTVLAIARRDCLPLVLSRESCFCKVADRPALYFEGEVFSTLEKPGTGYYSLGFALPGYRTKQVGWLIHSIAYHTDDGGIFYGRGFPKKHYKPFAYGVRGGIGLFLDDKSVFITEAGKYHHTGIILYDEDLLELVPMVGMNPSTQNRTDLMLRLYLPGSCPELLGYKCVTEISIDHATPMDLLKELRARIIRVTTLKDTLVQSPINTLLHGLRTMDFEGLSREQLLTILTIIDESLLSIRRSTRKAIENLCHICAGVRADVLLSPCNHLVLCSNCLKNQVPRTCPVCKKKVEECIPIYCS